VKDGSIFVEDGGVRGVADEGLAEDPLFLARDARLALARDDLGRLKLGELLAHAPLEEGLDALGPERLPEHSPRAEDLAHADGHAIEPELDESLDGEGELVAALGGAADELFEEEGVAPGAADDVAAHLGLGAREGGGDEAVGGEGREGREGEARDVPALPELRQARRDLRPREGEDAEAYVGAAEEPVDELDGGVVGPVHVLDEEDLGLEGGSRPHVRLEGHAEARLHELSARARGPEGLVVLVGEGDVRELAEEGREEPHVARHERGDVALDLLDLLVRLFAVVDADEGAEGAAEGREAGSAAHGVAPADEDGGAGGRHFEALHEL